MKRRDFFKTGAKGAVGAGMIPLIGNAGESTKPVEDRSTDKWFQLGTGENAIPDRKKTVQYDVAVLGGGMAGMCAAVSAARNGSRTVLVQDRSVLGGNASSEIRVHMNGVTHLKNGMPERETGVVEEILIHNRFLNPQESYPMWDHVLYDFVTREPNLDLMLNTQAVKANMKGNAIASARCWQMTTETEITIEAKQFIDCSGDGLLAATAGAEYRTGREGKKEYGEKYAPDEPDGWQMGSSILMSSKDMGEPTAYEPPSYVLKFDHENTHDHRKIKSFVDGFWWVEVGSEFDIISEQEEIRHRLMGYLHGVWDYIKNSGKFPEAENYALDWVGAIPGRRESRRFLGDFVLSETDLTEDTQFEDAVAYGGWSLDEHNPGGIENITEPPSYFHERFETVYQIPFRSLYSKNISNLLFAGRNISQTHIALSSSRLMGTCALMGQAVGTAANLCAEKGISPRDLATNYIDELQEQLLRDDAFIPDRPAQDDKDLAKTASAFLASSTSSGDVNLLIDGISRNENLDKDVHHWESGGLPANVQVEWEEPVNISKIEIKCDTNTQRNLLMRKDSRVSKTFWNKVPTELLKTLDVEARVKGKWVKVGSIEGNRTRLIKFAFDQVRATAIRINMKETYGYVNVKLFEVRCYEA